MKILITISKFLPEYSGPSKRIFELYTRLLKKKFLSSQNIQIICGGEEYNFNKNYKINNLKVKRFKNTYSRKNYINFFSYLKNLFLCRKEILSFKPDLIHVVGSNILTASAVLISRIYKIPLCIELVNSTAKPNQNFPILKYFWKPDLNKNVQIIAISKYLKNKCKKIGIKNIWYRPNPVNLKKFKLNIIKKKKK